MEIENQQRKERERIKTLIDEANAWEQANRIRLYVAAKRNAEDDSSATVEWAVWATQVADSIDPLTSTSAHCSLQR